MSNKHIYKLKYALEHESGKWTADEIKADSKMGGTDAIVQFSVIYPEDGSFSVGFTSVDGRNEGKPLDIQEIWKIWLLLGTNLAKREELDEVRRYVAEQPAKMFFEFIKADEEMKDEAKGESEEG